MRIQYVHQYMYGGDFQAERPSIKPMFTFTFMKKFPINQSSICYRNIIRKCRNTPCRQNGSVVHSLPTVSAKSSCSRRRLMLYRMWQAVSCSDQSTWSLSCCCLSSLAAVRRYAHGKQPLADSVWVTTLFRSWIFLRLTYGIGVETWPSPSSVATSLISDLRILRTNSV